MTHISKQISRSHNQAYNWDYISGHPQGIWLIFNNLEKVNLIELNRNPNAYIVLLKYPELIIWDVLIYNPNNAPVYAQHPHMITWQALDQNPVLAKFITTERAKIRWI